LYSSTGGSGWVPACSVPRLPPPPLPQAARLIVRGGLGAPLDGPWVACGVALTNPITLNALGALADPMQVLVLQ
jgi:hypothetical protein